MLVGPDHRMLLPYVFPPLFLGARMYSMALRGYVGLAWRVVMAVLPMSVMVLVVAYNWAVMSM